MRRFALLGGGLLATACSLINAPPDAEPQGGGCSSSDECAALTDACNLGACVNGTCAAQPVMDGTTCDDGKFCSENDQCKAGQCVGTDRVCMTKKPCDIGVCNEQTKTCDEMAGHDGMACDDGNPCDDPGSCAAGVCSPGPEKCSKLSTDCATGVCGGSGCTTMPTNEGALCNLSEHCSQSTCVTGTCTMTPLTTAQDGTPCDDGKFCTLDEKCLGGLCTPSNHSYCPPDGSCGTWACDENQKKCVGTAQNEMGSCSLNMGCQTNQKCGAGVCSGPSDATVYLQDDFHDNSHGWTLDGDWAIGPTVRSIGGQLVGMGAILFSEDPDADHTPNTLDNGVAGVALGGFADATSHGFFYLTSPPFDTSMAAGQVVLGFYRWLNSDYPPFMNDSIQVWDGTQWQTLFANQMNVPLNDSKWSSFTYDLTPYRNSAMRVRFGYDAMMGAFQVGSWNIDDVIVADQSCN